MHLLPEVFTSVLHPRSPFSTAQAGEREAELKAIPLSCTIHTDVCAQRLLTPDLWHRLHSPVQILVWDRAVWTQYTNTSRSDRNLNA